MYRGGRGKAEEKEAEREIERAKNQRKGRISN